MRASVGMKLPQQAMHCHKLGQIEVSIESQEIMSVYWVGCCGSCGLWPWPSEDAFACSCLRLATWGCCECRLKMTQLRLASMGMPHLGAAEWLSIGWEHLCKTLSPLLFTAVHELYALSHACNFV